MCGSVCPGAKSLVYMDIPGHQLSAMGSLRYLIDDIIRRDIV